MINEEAGGQTTYPRTVGENKNKNLQATFKARSHIETQLNSTVELSWVSVSFDMSPGVKTGVLGFLKTDQSGL